LLAIDKKEILNKDKEGSHKKERRSKTLKSEKDRHPNL
jgi:hypothetical protein